MALAALASPLVAACPAQASYNGPEECPGAIVAGGRYGESAYPDGDGITYAWDEYQVCEYPYAGNTVDDGWARYCQSSSSRPSGCGGWVLYETCWTESDGSWECSDGSSGGASGYAASSSLTALAAVALSYAPPGPLVGTVELPSESAARIAIDATCVATRLLGVTAGSNVAESNFDTGVCDAVSLSSLPGGVVVWFP